MYSFPSARWIGRASWARRVCHCFAGSSEPCRKAALLAPRQAVAHQPGWIVAWVAGVWQLAARAGVERWCGSCGVGVAVALPHPLAQGQRYNCCPNTEMERLPITGWLGRPAAPLGGVLAGELGLPSGGQAIYERDGRTGRNAWLPSTDRNVCPPGPTRRADIPVCRRQATCLSSCDRQECLSSCDRQECLSSWVLSFRWGLA